MQRPCVRSGAAYRVLDEHVVTLRTYAVNADQHHRRRYAQQEIDQIPGVMNQRAWKKISDQSETKATE